MPTDLPWVFVFSAVFLAALIQSTTGIGFGLIATPFLLIALTSSSAVQITIILSLVMSVILCVRTYNDCDVKPLKTLLFGGIVGLPIGLGVNLMLGGDSIGINLLAAVAVLWFAVTVAWQRPTSHDSKSTRPWPFLFGASVLSGAMTICLAMPGPALIGPLRKRCESDPSVRGTLFAFFVPAYGAALAVTFVCTKIAAETMWTSLFLLPAMVIGITLGHWLAPKLLPGQIKIAIVLILAATSLTLIAATITEVLI